MMENRKFHDKYLMDEDYLQYVKDCETNQYSNIDININNSFLNQKIVSTKILPKYGELTLQDIAKIAQTSRRAYTLFKPLINHAAKLLMKVAYGQQTECEELIKQDPYRMLEKNIVTDYSLRTFYNMSALQYAAWARDMHMLRMLLNNLPQDAIKSAYHQLNELDQSETEHGRCYDPLPLIRNLMTFEENRRKWPHAQKKKFGIEKIGGEQRKVPVHLANEYCSPSHMQFNSKRTFKEDIILRRTFIITLDNGSVESWYPLTKNPGLGVTYAIGANEKNLFEDAKAIQLLFSVRNEQYVEIKTVLLHHIEQQNQFSEILNKKI